MTMPEGMVWQDLVASIGDLLANDLVWGAIIAMAATALLPRFLRSVWASIFQG